MKKQFIELINDIANNHEISDKIVSKMTRYQKKCLKCGNLNHISYEFCWQCHYNKFNTDELEVIESLKTLIV